MNNFKFRSGKILSRKELKNIKGGDGNITPAPPSGGGSQLKDRKCCLTDFPDICSGCVQAYDNAVCGTGATLTDC